jgi:tetratricopeptide (TPR) repeat protein
MARLSGILFAFIYLSAPVIAETVLIVPFYNSSNSKNINWIGESLSEAMGDALSANGILCVTADERRTAMSSMGIRPGVRLTQASVLEVAINLSAGVAVHGEYSLAAAGQEAQKLRVMASVVDLRQMRRVARLEESGPLADLSRIQSRLSFRLLQSLRPGLTLTEESFLASRPSIRLDAMENHIRGLMATDSEQQIRYFSNAARLAPDYPEPNLRLGLYQLERKDYRAAAGWLSKVGASAQRAREAAFYLALCRHHLGEFQAARDLLDRLVTEAPLNEVYNNLGAVQARLDQEVALDSFAKAIEADPADPAAYFNAGYYLWRKGRFEEAIKRFNEVIERTPEDEAALLLLERCEDRQGPQPGDPRTERQERLKSRYDESGWLMLKQFFTSKPEAN